MSYAVVRCGSVYQVRRDVPGGTVAAFHGLRFATEKAAREAIAAQLAVASRHGR